MIGVGYVGLVSGTCFAELGNDVLCCDIDERKIDMLEKGEIPIYEPGLQEMVHRNVQEKRIHFSTDLKKAVDFGDLIFIAVGTPAKDFGQSDLKYVYSVAKTIGEHLDKDRKIIVNKSTVPVGTAQEVTKIISDELKKRNVSYEFSVVSNPEFLKEGDAIDDSLRPDRVVIGANEDWAQKVMTELYQPITKNGHPIFLMDTASSEMSKYAANGMLATKISFINQIANLCEIVGADVEEVRKAICADKRIGNYFLYPGVGYGGSCFPKDVQALAALGKKYGYLAHLVEATETTNEQQKEVLANKVIKEMGDIDGKKIAIWGLSFKPKTDDMRCAPAINIIEKLLAKGAKITAYDPVAMENAKKIFNSRICFVDEMYDCLDDAEALIIITEWSQFREPDFSKIKSKLKFPRIFDGRNIYSPERMKEYGFNYISIGRGGGVF
jgi:UDPglucose 6-dehydrogenase